MSRAEVLEKLIDLREQVCIVFLAGLLVFFVSFVITCFWLDRRGKGHPQPEIQGLVVNMDTEEVFYTYTAHQHVIRKGVCRHCKVPLDDILTSKGTQ